MYYAVSYNNCESYLAHHGVKGMRWGVRKAVYKSMTRQQKKKQKAKFYKTAEGIRAQQATRKAYIIGTLIGSPIVGSIAAGITHRKMTSVKPKTMADGRDTVYKFRKNRPIHNMYTEYARSIPEKTKNATIIGATLGGPLIGAVAGAISYKKHKHELRPNDRIDVDSKW